jgi:hypothetical protein
MIEGDKPRRRRRRYEWLAAMSSYRLLERTEKNTQGRWKCGERSKK